jgi:succinyl-diaminopimelate desuccinylase
MTPPIENELVGLTADLIGFPSMHSRPEEIGRCMDYIQAWLERHGIAARRLEQNGVPTLLVLPPAGRVPLLLMSHIDVVDAPEALFAPRIENGRLFGRGAIDDKYAAALSMVLVRDALAELRRRGRTPAELPCGLLISGDEEIGGHNGARAALGGLSADFAIALDGGRPDKIVVREKGILRLKLTARGRTAHGARPWLGENAIDALIADVALIRRHFPSLDPDHWERTLNFSRIQAGKAVNQVPDHAEALFDIRYTENDDMEAVVAAIRREIRGEVEVVEREPLFHGGASPHLDRLRELAGRPELGREHGASDARFLSEFGIPGIVWGADGEESAHAPDERLVLDSLFRLHRVLAEFIAGLF